MKKNNYKTTYKRTKVFLLVLFLLLLPYLSYSQNIVLSVTGKVLQNGRPVKKGDNLSNDLKVVFSDSNAELKVLSPVGVCVLKYKNYQEKKTSELLELIKSSIRKNSVATLGTRAWKVNPDKNKQVSLVDSLCKTLNVTPDNVSDMFRQYITPYCVMEFETPYWKDIAHFMQTKYGFNPSRFTGELMTPEEYQNIPLIPKTRSLVSLPPSASLKQYCPIPGYQGQYGTCTGWASAYAARTISWAIRNNLTDVTDITNQAFSPTFVYSLIKGSNDFDCRNGATIDRSVEVLKDNGAVFLTDLPYSCDANVTSFFQQAKKYAIKDYQRLTAQIGITSKEDFNNIKKALADKKPLVCAIKCYQSFGDKVWDGSLDNPTGNHAICMIGYDDNFNNGDGTYGAVEFMNSWSPIWGDGGFIHVKYQDLPKILLYAISLYDDALPVPPPEPPKPLPVPHPTPLPTPKPAPHPTPQPIQDNLKRMEGSFDLILSDGTSMQLEGNEGTFRGLKLVTAENMTYNIINSYPGGTMFRINFTSSQPAYVYVISTDSKHSPLAQLFPDPEQNVSALLDFTSEVSVSIPDETQYIQMDETPGEDYLCVIYSKDELDMNVLHDSWQNNNTGESFVKIVKETLADKIVDDTEVTFEKDKIAFKAASANHTTVPIFVKVKHK